MRVCAADFCCQKNAAPAGPARREYPRCRLEFVVESEFQIGRGEFQAEGLAAAAVEVVLAVAEEADLRQEAEVLVDLHAQSRCNTGLKALVVAAGEAYAAVEEERQNPLVIIFVTGIGRRREDVGAAAVLYFQVLVTERHAHRPSLVEIVARFGSDRERIGFDAFRLVVPVAQLAADPQTFLLRRSFVGRRKACSCCKQYDNDFLHLCCVFSLTEKWSCFSVPKAKKQRGFLTCK